MEDIQAYHFQCQQAIQINSVCLFLWINYLLEITNHNGSKLLPQMLEPQKNPPDSFYHHHPNHSTLLWLQQPSSGRTAWKQWKDAITWIYAKPDSITLQQPLRPWLSKFDHDYEWNWLIHPTTQQLYHRIGDKWHVYHPLCHTTNFIEYPATPTIRNQLPDNTQPVTPTLQPGCFQITAPIPMHHQPIPLQAPPTLTLLQ